MRVPKTTIQLVGALLILSTVSPAAAAPKAELWPVWQVHDDGNTAVIDHGPWQALLDRYLVTNDPSGINRFRYGAVAAADKTRLADYLRGLQKRDPRRYGRVQQKAYWINLYNALTVNLVIKHYPVKSILRIRSGFFRIGPWNDTVAHIAGHPITLNDIEHRILRPIFKDNRVHYALNCASLGCPNLSAKAYTAANMDKQLEAAVRAYVNSPRGVHFEDGELVLSKIYDWYQQDFGADEAAVLTYLTRYAEPGLAKQLRGYHGPVRYAYDWELNAPGK
jgi:hypothetical protein